MRSNLAEFCSFWVWRRGARATFSGSLGEADLQNWHGKQLVAGRGALDFDFELTSRTETVQIYLITAANCKRDHS